MLDKRVGIIYLGAFLGPFGGNAIFALVDVLGEEFHATSPEVLFSITLFMIPFAIIQFFSGTLSDIYEREKTAMFGFSVYLLGCLLCASSPNLAFFLGSRVVQGIGYAFVTPVILALLGDVTTRNGRGLAMGLMGSSTTAGLATGPLVAGLLGEANWRISFLLFAALAAALILLFGLVIRPWKREVAPVPTSPSLQGPTKRTVIQAAACLSLVGFLAFFTFVGVLAVISDVLPEEPYNMSAAEVGLVFASTGVAGIFISPFAGTLVDSVGRKRIGSIGFLIGGLSVPLLLIPRTLPEFLPVLFLLGCGTSLVWASLLTLTVEIYPARRGGVASMFNGTRFLGYALAPAIMPILLVGYGLPFVYLLALSITLLCSVLVRSIGTDSFTSKG